MDYYAKYIKYKTKYLELKQRLTAGACDKNQYQCTDVYKDDYCIKNKITCLPKKGYNKNCDEDKECLSGKCIKFENNNFCSQLK
jgi:hypothetical protein